MAWRGLACWGLFDTQSIAYMFYPVFTYIDDLFALLNECISVKKLLEVVCTWIKRTQVFRVNLIHTRKDTSEFQEDDCCLECSIYHTAKISPYTHAWNRLLFVFTRSQSVNLLTARGVCTHTVDLRCLMSCSAKTWLGWVAHHNPIRNDHWRSESNVELSILSFNCLPSDNFWLLIHTSAIHHYYGCAHSYCSYF